MLFGAKVLTGKMQFRDIFKGDNLHHVIVGALAFAFVGAACTSLISFQAEWVDPVIVGGAAVAGAFLSKTFVI